MIRARISRLAVPILTLLISAASAGSAFALPPGSGPGGGWSPKCVACRNDCQTRYGTDQGSLRQCYHLCALGGSCSSLSGGGGGGLPLPKKPKPTAPK
jgi:hypothetical protein